MIDPSSLIPIKKEGDDEPVTPPFSGPINPDAIVPLIDGATESEHSLALDEAQSRLAEDPDDEEAQTVLELQGAVGTIEHPIKKEFESDASIYPEAIKPKIDITDGPDNESKGLKLDAPDKKARIDSLSGYIDRVRPKIQQQAQGRATELLQEYQMNPDLDLPDEWLEQIVRASVGNTTPGDTIAEFFKGGAEYASSPIQTGNRIIDVASRALDAGDKVAAELAGDTYGLMTEPLKTAIRIATRDKSEAQSLPAGISAGLVETLPLIGDVYRGTKATVEWADPLSDPEESKELRIQGLIQSAKEHRAAAQVNSKVDEITKGDPTSSGYAVGQFAGGAVIGVGAEAVIAPIVARGARGAVNLGIKGIAKTRLPVIIPRVYKPVKHLLKGDLMKAGASLLLGESKAGTGWMARGKKALLGEPGDFEELVRAAGEAPANVPAARALQAELEPEISRLMSQEKTLRAKYKDKLEFVDNQTADGRFEFELDELHGAPDKQVRQVVDKIKLLQDRHTRMGVAADIHKVATDSIKAGIRLTGNTAVTAATMGAIAALEAPTGQTREATQEMLATGTLLGIPGAWKTSSHGVTEMKRRDLIRKGKKVIDKNDLIGLSRWKREFLYSHAAQVAPFGGKVRVLGEQEMFGQAMGKEMPEGSSAPNGLYQENTKTLFINRDTPWAMDHEIVHLGQDQANHVFEPLRKDILNRVKSKEIVQSEQYRKFSEWYLKAKKSTDPSAKELPPEEIADEVQAEIGRMVMNNISPETFYGGKSGQVILGEFLKKKFGKKNGKDGFLDPVGPFNAPVTHGDVANFRDILYLIGERVETGQKFTKFPKPSESGAAGEKGPGQAPEGPVGEPGAPPASPEGDLAPLTPPEPVVPAKSLVDIGEVNAAAAALKKLGQPVSNVESRLQSAVAEANDKGLPVKADDLVGHYFNGDFVDPATSKLPPHLEARAEEVKVADPEVVEPAKIEPVPDIFEKPIEEKQPTTEESIFSNPKKKKETVKKGSQYINPAMEVALAKHVEQAVKDGRIRLDDDGVPISGDVEKVQDQWFQEHVEPHKAPLAAIKKLGQKDANGDTPTFALKYKGIDGKDRIVPEAKFGVVPPDASGKSKPPRSHPNYTYYDVQQDAYKQFNIGRVERIQGKGVDYNAADPGKFMPSGSPQDGRRYSFRYIRNTERAPNMGDRFGQDIEPHGRYLNESSVSEEHLSSNMIVGNATFENPIVIPAENWKKNLSNTFRGLKGKALSKAIVSKGHDGIITTDKYGTGEIVDLRNFGNPKINNTSFMPSTHPRALKEAALKTEDGKIFSGKTHAEAFDAGLARGEPERALEAAEHGFTTNDGEFLGRVAASSRGIETDQLPKGFENHHLDSSALDPNSKYMPAGPGAESDPWVHRYFELDRKESRGKLSPEETKEMDNLHQQAVQEYGTYDNFYKTHGGEQYNARNLFNKPEQPLRFMASDEGFYSKLEKHLEDKMPERATSDQINGLIKSGGIKKAEIEWNSPLRDLLDSAGDRKLTKQEVLDAARQGTPKVTEVVSGEKKLNSSEQSELEDLQQKADESGLSPVEQGILDRLQNSGATKFGEYQLPGGENYREVKLTLPTSTRRSVYEKTGVLEPYGEAQKRDFKSSHFDEPNIVAHARVNDRTTVDGRSMLFGEELQSDWAQKGRKEGFASTKDITRDDAKKLGYSVYQTKSNLGSDAYFLDGPGTNSIGFKTEAEAWKSLFSQIKEKSDAVPDMPFKGEAWKKLLLRTMIKDAVKSGKDSIGWTTGEQQAARYDLSRQVSSINIKRKSNGTYDIKAFKDRRGGALRDLAIERDNVHESKLEEIIGKDLAKKAAEQKEDSYDYSGVDLKVGGEGMKGFYDRELVNIANDLGKKYGAKVREAQIQTEAGRTTTIHELPITDALRAEVEARGQQKYMPSSHPEAIVDTAIKTPDGKVHTGIWAAIRSGETPETLADLGPAGKESRAARYQHQQDLSVEAQKLPEFQKLIQKREAAYRAAEVRSGEIRDEASAKVRARLEKTPIEGLVETDMENIASFHAQEAMQADSELIKLRQEANNATGEMSDFVQSHIKKHGPPEIPVDPNDMPMGAIHEEIMRELEGEYGNGELGKSIDGFMTRDGRFLDRKEALNHAAKIKQIDKGTYQKQRAEETGKPKESIKNLESDSFNEQRKYLPSSDRPIEEKIERRFRSDTPYGPARSKQEEATAQELGMKHTLESNAFSQNQKFMASTPRTNAELTALEAKYNRDNPDAIPTKFKRDSDGKIRLIKGEPQVVEQPYAVMQTPEAIKAARDIKDKEKAKEAVSSRMGDGLVEEYNRVIGNPEVAQATGWYKAVRERLTKLFDNDNDMWDFCQFLGVTSAGEKPYPNLDYALDAYNSFKSGRFDDLISRARALEESGIKLQFTSTFLAKHNLLPVMERIAESTGNPSNYSKNGAGVLQVAMGRWDANHPLKTYDYAGNFSINKPLKAVIDMWAARTGRRLMGGKRIAPKAETQVTNADYRVYQDAYNKAADKLGIGPDDLHAILWFAEKSHWDSMGWVDKNMGDIRPYLPHIEKSGNLLKFNRDQIADEHLPASSRRGGKKRQRLLSL